MMSINVFKLLKNKYTDVLSSYWAEQYSYIVVFILISLILTIVLIGVGFLATRFQWIKNEFEKQSPYECGFEPFGDAHSVFNIQFFVVGILFMIFDLELAYLFPWVIHLGNLSLFSFFLMVFFLILLTIGFIYEWKKGALDWL